MTTEVTLFEMLPVTIAVMLAVWYLKHYWNNRRLYRLAAERPGPPALPLIGNALYFLGSSKDIFRNLVEMFKGDSPTKFWLGPKLYFSIRMPDDMEVILNSPHALEKDVVYKYLTPYLGTGLITAPVSKWKRHRKVIMPTFNQKLLHGFVEVFTQQSVILVKQFKRVIGKGMFDCGDYVNRCSLDLICETAMGTTVNAQTTDCNYAKWLDRSCEITVKRVCGIWYHNDFIFNLTSLAKDLNKAIMNLQSFAETVINKKRNAFRETAKEVVIEEGDVPVYRQTFLEKLVELSENGGNFTTEEIQEEVNTFIGAGSETVATTVCFTLIMLGMFPDIQEEVYKEVIDVLGPDRLVNSEDLGKLPYTEKVIKETLRLFPAAPFTVHAVTSDIKLEKCVIPEGCSVVTSFFSLHRSAEVWSNPLKFDPDRFLPEAVAERHLYSWLPFAGGPRNCVGSKYAMLAIKTMIAMVVRKYRISTSYQNIEDIELKLELLIRPVHGYQIAIQPRE